MGEEWYKQVPETVARAGLAAGWVQMESTEVMDAFAKSLLMEIQSLAPVVLDSLIMHLADETNFETLDLPTIDLLQSPERAGMIAGCLPTEAVLPRECMPSVMAQPTFEARDCMPWPTSITVTDPMSPEPDAYKKTKLVSHSDADYV